MHEIFALKYCRAFRSKYCCLDTSSKLNNFPECFVKFRDLCDIETSEHQKFENNFSKVNNFMRSHKHTT